MQRSLKQRDRLGEGEGHVPSSPFNVAANQNCLSETVRTLNKERYINYYTNQRDYIEMSLENQGYDTASALFDILCELKRFSPPYDTEAIKMRKNGYMPGISHEVDLLLPIITTMNSSEGFVNKNGDYSQHAEELEELICAVICHDIGEEYNWFSEDFKVHVSARLAQKGINITERIEQVIERSAQRMERLTDCRDFKADEVRNLMGEQDFDLSGMKPGDVLDLPHLKDVFWDKMDVLDDHGRENLQVYAFWHEKKKAPVIRVTRYGMSREDEPKETTFHGVDLGLYHSTIVQDLLCEITKRLDTNHNFATLIDKGDIAYETEQYVSKKKEVWQNIRRHCNDHSESPFRDFIESLANQTTLLARILRTHISCLEDSRTNGGKNIGMNGMYYYEDEFASDQSSSCELAYQYVDHVSHPTCRVLAEMAEYPDTSSKGNDKLLFNNVTQSVLDFCNEDTADKLRDMVDFLLLDEAKPRINISFPEKVADNFEPLLPSNG